MFGSFLLVAIVRYLSIYHSVWLELMPEDQAILMLRACLASVAMIGLVIDYFLAPRVGVVYQFLGDLSDSR